VDELALGHRSFQGEVTQGCELSACVETPFVSREVTQGCQLSDCVETPFVSREVTQGCQLSDCVETPFVSRGGNSRLST